MGGGEFHQSHNAFLEGWSLPFLGRGNYMLSSAGIKLSIDTAIADCFSMAVALHTHTKGQADASQALSSSIPPGLITFE